MTHTAGRPGDTKEWRTQLGDQGALKSDAHSWETSGSSSPVWGVYIQFTSGFFALYVGGFMWLVVGRVARKKSPSFRYAHLQDVFNAAVWTLRDSMSLLLLNYKPSNMHRGQGSKVSISKQEPCGIFILTYVTLQVKTFPTMYFVYLYGKVFIFSFHGHKPSQA